MTITASAQTLTCLASFDDHDRAVPTASLVQRIDRNVYGARFGGGARKKPKTRALYYRPRLLCTDASLSLRAAHPAVIVAVTIMRVMQMAIDQVVYMIAVGHCFVSAVVAVLMCSTVACTIVTARAIRGIRCVDLKPVLIDVALVERVQVAIVEVVGVSVVDNR
jgi:hypothetical protein